MTQQKKRRCNSSKSTKYAIDREIVITISMTQNENLGNDTTTYVNESNRKNASNFTNMRQCVVSKSTHYKGMRNVIR